MATTLLTEKYESKIQGVLNCYDRILISGNLQPLCYAKGMTKYLYDHDIRIFDYAKFAEPLRDMIRANMQTIAQQNGITIEYVNHGQVRKEERIEQILQERGEQPGLVHIFSAMERCGSYQPWHDKQIHKTYLKPKPAKCVHYYVYFIDEALGLCYLRVPTWCPFRLQVYLNGHNWLASQLKEQQIGFELCDNAFIQLDDVQTANELAADLDIISLHDKLNQLAQRYCPVVSALELHYSWSISQAELATDIIFKQPSALQAIYAPLLETLVHTVKPDDIATFLGRKGLHGKYQGDLGSRLNVRLEGRRIKHWMGPASLKMYDKFKRVLRIETTINDVTFFYQYRQVHHRTGSPSTKWVPMKKTIYSLPALHQALSAANHRYLAFISDIETPEVGVSKLQRLTETKTHKKHRYKGFNLLAQEDTFLLRLLVRGEFFVSGFTNKALRQHLDHKNSGQVSRLLKRLRVHGLIKKVAKRYKYYLTTFGRQVVTMALKLREMHIIPSLAFDQSAGA